MSDDNVPFVHPEASKCSSSASSSSNSSYVSDSHKAKKRKRVAYSAPNGLDRIYIDNQKLWRKIAHLQAEHERSEERLRFAHLEANNRHLTTVKLTNENKELKVQLVKAKSATWWTIVQRNLILVVWLVWLYRAHIALISMYANSFVQTFRYLRMPQLHISL